MTITMKKIAAVLFSTAMAGSVLAAGEADSLRTALEDGKTSGKGLTFYVSGSAIPGLVVSVNDKYVVAKSQAQGAIVIKLEKIDAVAGFVGDRK
jgi:hypothetical protein